MQRKHSVLEATVPEPEAERRAKWESYLKERAEKGFIDPPTGPNRRQRKASRRRMKPNADPNQPCPCGSGKTFGDCHLAQAIAMHMEMQPVVLSKDARREARNRRKATKRARSGR